jgi:type III pantothenate kinase
LIGNSRWHWASGDPDRLRCWSEAPGCGQAHQLRAWAAVGPVPDVPWLLPRRRLGLGQIPLAQVPPWLGVDRALVGWRAWQRSQAPVLVVDAGTALSLTRVDRSGAFAGGRIQAGRALQLRALARHTDQLPPIAAAPLRSGEALAPWPRQTVDAMETGVRQGLVAAVAQAWRELRELEPDCHLWITGGDGPWLAAALDQPCHPNLALEALVALSPGPEG